MNEVKLTCKRQFEEIHEKIKDGDIDSVKHLLQDETPGQPLCFEGYSALKRSFLCEQPEISAFLVHFGVTLKDHETVRPGVTDEDVDLINLLWYFLQKKEKSTVDALTTSSYFVLDNYQISIVSDCGEWLKEILEKKEDYFLWLLHSASKRNVCLEDLLQFCKAHLKKEEIKEMLLSCDENGNTVVHRIIRTNFPETMMKNLILFKENVGNDSLFKQLLKSVDQCHRNIFHLAAMRDLYIENMIRFCIDSLEREDVMKMFLSCDKSGNNVLHHLIMNDSFDILIRNMNVIKEVLGDLVWNKRFLKTETYERRNIFHLAAKRKINLDHLFRLCANTLEKDDIIEMLLSNDNDGNDVIYFVLMIKTSETILRTLKAINEIGGKDEWLKELFKSKVTNFWKIFVLCIERSDSEGLDQFCNAHLRTDDIKDFLLSLDDVGNNMIHFLCQNFDSDTVVKILGVIKDKVGDKNWLKKFLISKGRDLSNVFHIAASRAMNLENVVEFYGSNLGMDEVKEMLLSNNEDGYNVIDFILRKSPYFYLGKNLNVIKNTLYEDILLKQLIEGRKSLLTNKMLYSGYIRVLCFADLLIFCNNLIEKDEIKDILIRTNDEGDNLIHTIIEEEVSDIVSDKLQAVHQTVGDDKEWFKLYLKSKGSSFRNIFHAAAVREKYFEDLVRFCGAHLEKDEIQEMLLSADADGYNVVHNLILNDNYGTLEEKLNVIKEVLEDKERFKLVLQSKGKKSRNVFHLFAKCEHNLGNWMNYCKSQFGKDEMKEMMLCVDNNQENAMHYFMRHNLLRYLEEDLDYINEVADDKEWFKILLKSKGRYFRNILLAFKPKYYLCNLLVYCEAHLKKNEIKEMLLSPDEFGNNVMQYLLNEVDSEDLTKILKFINKIFGDDDFLRQFLKSKGKNSWNLFHLAAKRNKYFPEVVKFCGAYFQVDEIRDMIFSDDVDSLNALHLLFEENSTESVMETLNHIKDVLGEDERFQKLLESKGILLDHVS